MLNMNNINSKWFEDIQKTSRGGSYKGTHATACTRAFIPNRCNQINKEAMLQDGGITHVLEGKYLWIHKGTYISQ